MRLLLSLLAALICSLAAHADDLTLRLRYPDIHGDTIVFVHAGDLWSVPAGGGDARRLTSHDGQEILPRFSPDGTTIAFTAAYEGSDDVYTIPSAGGGARRLTWHPYADRVTGWTPDGRIVFRSKRSSTFSSFDRLFTLSAEGGVAGELPLPAGGMSSFSPDMSKIAYNPTSTETYYWKRYRGGQQSHIAIYDFKTHAYEEIPHGEAAELFPMWFRDAIFFVSDRDGVMNLYRYDIASRAIRQLTHHTVDTKWPSLAADGSGRIVYETAGRCTCTTSLARLRRAYRCAFTPMHPSHTAPRSTFRGGCRPSLFPLPAPERFSAHGEKSSPFQPARARSATSPTPPARGSCGRCGRPTANGSRMHPTRVASMSCTFARRTAAGKSGV